VIFRRIGGASVEAVTGRHVLPRRIVLFRQESRWSELTTTLTLFSTSYTLKK